MSELILTELRDHGKVLRQIRDQLAALNLGLAELNLGICALIGEKQVKNGDWVSLDSLKPKRARGKK